MKPGKPQRSKRTEMTRSMLEGPRPCTIFSLIYAMHGYLTKTFLLVVPQAEVNSYCVVCTVKAKKNEQKHAAGFHN